MKPRNSRILRELAAGRSSTCFKANLSDPRVIEIAGLSGMSSIWLCNEHVPDDWLNLEHQIRAARLHDMDSLVRVSKGSYSEYIKPLEADATGIIVPHVTTAEEARQIVQWSRFHPMGRRPLDGGNMDGMFCQLPLAEYLEHSNRERLIILQIESPAALENVEAIAAVAGYNALMFGPGDFSHLIGKPGQTGLPEVIAARKRVAAAARAHGKWAFCAGLPAPRKELEEEGYRCFVLGADVIGLVEYARERLRLFEDAGGAKAAGEGRGL